MVFPKNHWYSLILDKIVPVFMRRAPEIFHVRLRGLLLIVESHFLSIRKIPPKSQNFEPPFFFSCSFSHNVTWMNSNSPPAV